MSAAAALANDVTPAHLRGSQSALMNQCGDVTFMVMPVALTVVATHSSYTVAFVTTASLLASANVGFALLARPPPIGGWTRTATGPELPGPVASGGAPTQVAGKSKSK